MFEAISLLINRSVKFKMNKQVMKTSLIFLALAGFIATTLGAPSTEVADTVEDTRIATNVEVEDESIRSKKSVDKPQFCAQATDREGRSYLQCSDAETAASSQYSSYSAPSSSYGGSQSYGAPAASYGAAPAYQVS